LQDREPVGRRALDEVYGDPASGADLALDQHIRRIASAHPLGERPRHQISHAAGRKSRNDERIAGKLCARAARERGRSRGEQAARDEVAPVDHLRPP
jgi:hypothetical protein